MISLLADVISDAVSAVSGSAAIPAVLLILVIYWLLRKLLEAQEAKLALLQKVADDAKADGQADGKMQAETTAALREATVALGETKAQLQELVDQSTASDKERRGIVEEMNERLDEVVKAVKSCQVRP